MAVTLLRGVDIPPSCFHQLCQYHMAGLEGGRWLDWTLALRSALPPTRRSRISDGQATTHPRRVTTGVSPRTGRCLSPMVKPPRTRAARPAHHPLHAGHVSRMVTPDGRTAQACCSCETMVTATATPLPDREHSWCGSHTAPLHTIPRDYQPGLITVSTPRRDLTGCRARMLVWRIHAQVWIQRDRRITCH